MCRPFFMLLKFKFVIPLLITSVIVYGLEYCWHWFWSTGQEFSVWECFLANIPERFIAGWLHFSFQWRRHENRRDIDGFLAFVLPWLWLYSSTLCLISGHTPLHTRPRVHSLAWWYSRFCKGSSCDTERPRGSAPPHIWHNLYTSSSLTKIRLFHPHTRSNFFLWWSAKSTQCQLPVHCLWSSLQTAKCRPTGNSDASFHPHSPAPGMLEGPILNPGDTVIHTALSWSKVIYLLLWHL